jgi:hypothetical protein
LDEETDDDGTNHCEEGHDKLHKIYRLKRRFRKIQFH